MEMQNTLQFRNCFSRCPQATPRQPAVCDLLEGVLQRIGRVTSKVVVQKAEFFEAVKEVISGSKSMSKKYNEDVVMACLDSGPQVLDDALLYLSKTGKVNTVHLKLESSQ